MMAAPARWRRHATAVAAGVCLACYTYAPVGGNGVSPGNQLAVDLTTEGSAALAQMIGPAVTTIEGRLISADSTGETVATRHRGRGGSLTRPSFHPPPLHAVSSSPVGHFVLPDPPGRVQINTIPHDDPAPRTNSAGASSGVAYTSTALMSDG